MVDDGRPRELKTIGVLGGMGPAATVDFFRRLTEATRAGSDTEHLHVVVDSDPSVPDRTAALTGRGPSPVPQLLRMGRRLQAVGAEILVMPCNTAHAYVAEVQAGLSVPLVRWIDEAVAGLRRRHPDASGSVGLLATEGTIKAGLYQRAFAVAGLPLVLPSPCDQDELMAIIYGADGVKAGNQHQPRLSALAARLTERGAEIVLIACTDLSTLRIGSALTVATPILDAAQLVAERVIELAGGTLRSASELEPA